MQRGSAVIETNHGGDSLPARYFIVCPS